MMSVSGPKRSSIGYVDFSGGAANFVTGCTPESRGCLNCYARALFARGGRNPDRVEMSDDKLARLLDWHPRDDVSTFRRFPQSSRPLVFVCDMGDLFHAEVPFEFIYAAFTVMWERRDVDWLVLTKRSARLLEFSRWAFPVQYESPFQSTAATNVKIDALMARLCGKMTEWPANVWAGVTVEDQAHCTRIDDLIQVPARVRWLSIEPMLEPIWLEPRLDPQRIHWVVCGAESGARRRPFSETWAKGVYNQCRRQGIAFFGKQDSDTRPGFPLVLDVGGKRTTIHEWPNV